MHKSHFLSALIGALIIGAIFMTSCKNLTRTDYSTVPDETVSNIPANPDATEAVTAPNLPIIEDLAVTLVLPETIDTVPVEETEPVSPSSLTLCLLGDIMCLSGQQYCAALGDGTHDYTGNYTLIRPVFDKCDYVIGNLETCLSPSSPYSSQAKKIDNRPNCNASADLLDSLTAVGITHLVTANNHCLDADTIGISETLAALDNAGISHTGTHTPEEFSGSNTDYMLITSDDITVAVISVTELINRRDLVTPSAMNLYVNEYSRDFFTEKIQAARNEGAAYVIVYEHWGNENTHELLDIQKEHARIIAEAGADLIIGSHSHCIQPKETIETSDGRHVPCYYSLGNVVSSMEKEINHDTVLVNVRLMWDTADYPVQGEGIANRSLVPEITVIPCHMIWNLDGVQFVIAPTDYVSDSSSVNTLLQTAEERILAVLDNVYIRSEE